MQLFISPLACSMASRITLNEANADFAPIEVDRVTKRIVGAGEDYRAINPLGLVPALRLDDGAVITENAAILEYLADLYPEAGLAPPATDRVGRAKLRQWLSFVATELHKGLMIPLLSREAPPEAKAWALQRYGSRLLYVDRALENREFLLDRFSVADAYLTTVLNWTQATPEIDMSLYPHAKAYLERMRVRKSVAAALATEVPLFRAEMARRKAA